MIRSDRARLIESAKAINDRFMKFCRTAAIPLLSRKISHRHKIVTRATRTVWL